VITFGFLSKYPPTLCGIASFTASLRAALPADAAGGVIRLVDPAGTDPVDAAWPAEVVGELVPESLASCRAAAAQLNREDVVVVQHEYGIYGGENGVDVLRVLTMLSVPVVIVVHTVLAAPTAHQRAVLHRAASAAAAVVVMSETARLQLIAGYDVPANRVVVIPHGAQESVDAPEIRHRRQCREILTWGLLCPGKGIRWGIEAMALLDNLRPEPRYVVAGQTHPRVLAWQGNWYHRWLLSRAEELGVRDRVHFESRYLDAESLRCLLARAEVVLLPYESREQVTSGVLVEAIAAGIPVVATRFPHAVELLSSGAGILVDHQDPAAIAAAIRRILTDRAAAAGMVAATRNTARTFGWASVGNQYYRLAAGFTGMDTGSLE
jgi:glycosyltransferase involved in cell wall biosynthesis